MNRGTVKHVVLLAAAVITICSVFHSAAWPAGPGVADAAGSMETDFAEPDEEISFDGEVAGVITAAVVLCGVVIVVVNGRSKRK